LKASWRRDKPIAEADTLKALLTEAGRAVRGRVWSGVVVIARRPKADVAIQRP
jgi:hypothetical protein